MIACSMAAQPKRLIVMICFSIILWGVCCGNALADETATLNVLGVPETVAQGDVFDVSFELAGVEGLYGFDLRVLYDAQVMHVVDQDPESQGAQMAVGDLLSPDFVVTNLADNEAGAAWLVMTHLNPRMPVTGTGTAMIVTFEAVRDGVPGIQIAGATLAKRDGDKQPVRLGDEAFGEVLDAQAMATDAPTATNAPAATTVPTTTDAPTVAPTVTAAPTATVTMTLPTAGEQSRTLQTVLLVAMIVVLAGIVVILLLKRRWSL